MKYDSRKFIDLILAKTSKWANWDPPRAIKVGDVGKINKRTGEFEWQGNIYDISCQDQLGDALGVHMDLQDAALKPVTQERTDDYMAVSSRGVLVKVTDLSVNVGVQDVAIVRLAIDCQFTSKCGAALVVYKPQLSCLPRDEKLMRLLKRLPAVLKGKYIVTDVISCPAYGMVMSTQEGENFSASLGATLPVPTGITVGGTVKVGWTADAVSGLWRSGNHDSPIYYPLYKLKQPPPSFWDIISGRRSHTEQSDSIESWEDAQPPWDPLDDEGEEDEIFDAALEGEELDWDD